MHTRKSVRHSKTTVAEDGTVLVQAEKGGAVEHGDVDLATFSVPELAQASKELLDCISGLSKRQVKNISSMPELKSLAAKISYFIARYRGTIQGALRAAAEEDEARTASVQVQLATAGAATGGGRGLLRLSAAGQLKASLTDSGVFDVESSSQPAAPVTATAASDIRSSTVGLYVAILNCTTVVRKVGSLMIFADTRMGRDIMFMRTEVANALSTLLAVLPHAPKDGRWPGQGRGGGGASGWPLAWVDTSRVTILGAGVVFPLHIPAEAATQRAAALDLWQGAGGQERRPAQAIRLWEAAAMQGDALSMLQLAHIALHRAHRAQAAVLSADVGTGLDDKVSAMRWLLTAMPLAPCQPAVLTATGQFLAHMVLNKQRAAWASLGPQEGRQTPHANLAWLEGPLGAPRLPLRRAIMQVVRFLADAGNGSHVSLAATLERQEAAAGSEDGAWEGFWSAVLSAAIARGLAALGAHVHGTPGGGFAPNPPPMGGGQFAPLWQFAAWAGVADSWAQTLQSTPAGIDADKVGMGQTDVTHLAVLGAAPTRSDGGMAPLGAGGAALLAAHRRRGVAGGLPGRVGSGSHPTAAGPQPSEVPRFDRTRCLPVRARGMEASPAGEPGTSQWVTSVDRASDRAWQRSATLGSVAAATLPDLSALHLMQDGFEALAQGEQGQSPSQATRGLERRLQTGAGPRESAGSARLMSLASRSRSRALARYYQALVDMEASGPATSVSAPPGGEIPSSGVREFRGLSRLDAASPAAPSSGRSVTSRLSSGRLSGAQEPGRATTPHNGSSLNRRITREASGRSLRSGHGSDAAPLQGMASAGQADPAEDARPPAGGEADATTSGPLGGPSGDTAREAAPSTALADPGNALQLMLESVDVGPDAAHPVHAPAHSRSRRANAAYSAYDAATFTWEAPASKSSAPRASSKTLMARATLARLGAEVEARGLVLHGSAGVSPPGESVAPKPELTTADLEVITDLEHFLHPRPAIIQLLETMCGFNVAAAVSHLWSGAGSGIGLVGADGPMGPSPLKLHMPPDTAQDWISESAHKLAEHLAGPLLPRPVMYGEGAVGCMQPFLYRLSGPATLVAMATRQSLRGYTVTPSAGDTTGLHVHLAMDPGNVDGETAGHYAKSTAAALIDLSASLYDVPSADTSATGHLVDSVPAPPGPGGGPAAVVAATETAARVVFRELQALDDRTEVHIVRSMLTAAALGGGDGAAALNLGGLWNHGIVDVTCASTALVAMQGAATTTSRAGDDGEADSPADSLWLWPPCIPLAAAWYAIGAGLGNARAANNLGALYSAGLLGHRLPAGLLHTVGVLLQHHEGKAPAPPGAGGSPVSRMPQGAFATLVLSLARLQLSMLHRYEPGQAAEWDGVLGASLTPAEAQSEAIHWFSMAGDAGEGTALNNLGVATETGAAGDPGNPFLAEAYYRGAAEAGVAGGIFNYAYMLAQRSRSAPELASAKALLTAAAQRGVPAASFQLGSLLEVEAKALHERMLASAAGHGHGVRPGGPARGEKAHRSYGVSRALATSSHPGHGSAEIQATAQLQRRVSLDALTRQALVAFMGAARGGDAFAALKCGHYFYDAAGVEAPSYETAACYYLAAACGGDARGLNSLACMVEDGKGWLAGPDKLRAEILFRLAAGDSEGAAVLLWELHMIQHSEFEQHSHTAQQQARGAASARSGSSVASTSLTTWRPLAPGSPDRVGSSAQAPASSTAGVICAGDEALPHLPVAVLASLPVPNTQDSNAMMNLYWMYKRRGEALLGDVFALQAQSTRPEGESPAPLGAHVKAAVVAAFKDRPWLAGGDGASEAGDGVRASAAHLEAHWLAEASAYRAEAATWLRAAAARGHRQALTVQRSQRAQQGV